MARLTVFTPTYNRASTIRRVYDSLLNQTYKDFIWLIVDDGSSDNTKEVVDDFIKDGIIHIKYYFQNNKGKHIATNFALRHTESELFIIADSDDGFVSDAFRILISAWDDIPDKEKSSFKGVNCRVFNHDTGKAVGSDFPFEVFDATDEEAYFKYKMRSEKWNLMKTSAFREFMFPEIPNAHFFPETVTWQLMSRRYKTRFLNIPLREYYNDAENSIIFGKESIRYIENIYLWEHFINNELNYFFYYPKRFIQSFVGINRDGLLNGYSLKQIINMVNGPFRKMLCIIFLPFGGVLALRYKNSRGE